MNPIFYVAIAVAAVAAVIAIIFTVKRYTAIKKNGVEADAVVSRIKEVENQNDDGSYDTTYTYYVKFTTQDGQTVEAKLGSAPRFTREGDRLRIKYLPEKPKNVILVK